MSNQELFALIRKNAIFVACLVLSAIIGITWYLRSGLLPDEEKVLAEKSKQGELISANIEDSHQLKEQYAQIVDANQTIANRMIRTGQLAENLQYFYRLENETGTKLTGDPRPVVAAAVAKNAPKTTYTPVGFNLAVQGSYVQLIDLLRRLENGEHYCRVIACNMKPMGESRTSPMTLSLSIELLGIQ
jgi:hypothetical protein